MTFKTDIYQRYEKWMRETYKIIETERRAAKLKCNLLVTFKSFQLLIFYFASSRTKFFMCVYMKYEKLHCHSLQCIAGNREVNALNDKAYSAYTIFFCCLLASHSFMRFMYVETITEDFRSGRRRRKSHQNKRMEKNGL